MRRSVRAGHETLAYTLMQTGRSSVELRVLPTEIRLFTPCSYPLRRADAYVAAHADWIREAQSRFEAYAGGELDPDSVSERLRACLIRRATERLNARVEHYVPLIGRRPGRVTVRDQRTKWGSCSTLGNVNFNWKLIMAPPEALDYVVIHELCHLYEFNHSDRFWQRVGRYQRDYAHWRDFLRSGWNHPFG